jgi:hypothetical protein
MKTNKRMNDNKRPNLLTRVRSQLYLMRDHSGLVPSSKLADVKSPANCQYQKEEEESAEAIRDVITRDLHHDNKINSVENDDQTAAERRKLTCSYMKWANLVACCCWANRPKITRRLVARRISSCAPNTITTPS